MSKYLIAGLFLLVNCAPPLNVQIIQAYGKAGVAPNMAKVPVDSVKAEVADE